MEVNGLPGMEREGCGLKVEKDGRRQRKEICRRDKRASRRVKMQPGLVILIALYCVISEAEVAPLKRKLTQFARPFFLMLLVLFLLR